MSAIPKPASLQDVNVRFSEMVHASDEGTAAWAELLGTTTRRVHVLTHQQHGRLSAKELSAIDELTGGAFLTPPEKNYVARASARSEYAMAWRRRNY